MVAHNVVMLDCLCDTAEQCRVSGRPRLKLLDQLKWLKSAIHDVDTGFDRFDLVILCSLMYSYQLRKDQEELHTVSNY
jgi:hypothetical protein